MTKSFCGSVAYLAPEIIDKTGHGKSLDWYTYGLFLYEMLVGQPPYYASSRSQLYENIRKAELKFPKSMPSEAKDLISKLLDRNKLQRLGAAKNGSEDIKKHIWFKNIDWDLVLKRELKPPKPKVKEIPNEPLEFNIFEDDGKSGKKVANWSIVK